MHIIWAVLNWPIYIKWICWPDYIVSHADLFNWHDWLKRSAEQAAYIVLLKQQQLLGKAQIVIPELHMISLAFYTCQSTRPIRIINHHKSTYMGGGYKLVSYYLAVTGFVRWIPSSRTKAYNPRNQERRWLMSGVGQWSPELWRRYIIWSWHTLTTDPEITHSSFMNYPFVS